MPNYITKEPYDLAIYIGRFSPFHIGHEATLHKAFRESKAVLVLIGSIDKPRTIKDPWTFEERKSMIEQWHDLAQHNVFVQDKPFFIEGIRDFPQHDNLWAMHVQLVVSKIESLYEGKKVALYGVDKDSSTYYLKMFPQWERVGGEVVEDPRFGYSKEINATKIRDTYFTDPLGIDKCGEVAPTPVVTFLRHFMLRPEYAQLKREYEFIQGYKDSWKNAPYPPTFVTTDAVVIQSGHVLLIRRRTEPGKGLWALPGGFVGQEERLIDSCIRELREETGLKVPEKVLKGSLYKTDVFDRPDRSTRGRTITHAFYFKLDDAQPLPHIKGGDDADKARWVPLGEFVNMESLMYEDHFHIVQGGL